MTKRILLAVVLASCIAALFACSAESAKPSSVGASIALQSESPSPSVTPIQTATVTESSTPSESETEVEEPSGQSSEPSSSGDSSGTSVGQVVNADEVNQKYTSSLKTDGEDIKVAIQDDTFTFNVTLDQDIKAANFISDMQSQYTEDMNKQIQTIISEYPSIPDCLFVYNLMNHSGEVLMKQTQYYQAE